MNHHSVFSDAIKYLFFCGILTCALFTRNISLGLGLFFGGSASLLNYRLLVYSTERLFSGNVQFPLFYGLFYLLRIAVGTAVIAAAMKFESINLFTACIGLMWVRISILVRALANTATNK